MDLEVVRDKKKAQERENYWAAEKGCKSYGGGAPATGPWSIYYFEYVRKRVKR